MFQFPGFASHTLFYSGEDTQLMLGGFPHSEIVGYYGFYHLTNAYRRLTRPSSPLIA